MDALAVQGADGPRIFTLQGADQGYRTLIEQMNEGALLLSEDATMLYGNARLAELLGLDLSEVIGSTFDAFVLPTFRDYWAGLVLKGWQGKSKGELPLKTSAGPLVPFSVSMNVLTFNDTPALAVIVTDLSAQREISAIRAQVAEQNTLLDQKTEELKREEAARQAGEYAAAEARRILEGIPHIAWTASPGGQLTYLNRRWYDFTGQDRQAPLTSEWSQYLHPADTRYSGRLEQCLLAGQPFELEFRFRNLHGEYRWMLGRGLPSHNEKGETTQWIGTCTDIHEHKLALERIDQGQRLLRDNNEQLTRVNVDLDNFIYTASHDLKAPISNIEGLLDALLLELPPETAGNGEIQPLLALMQDSVNRFKRTIDHLTEVSKLQKEHGQSTGRGRAGGHYPGCAARFGAACAQHRRTGRG